MEDILDSDTQKVLAQFQKLRKEHEANYRKSLSMLEIYQKELIDDPLEEARAARANGEVVEDPVLSVSAQVLIEKEVSKIRELSAAIADAHRLQHSSISKIGKHLDRNFESDLSGILREEKDIEGRLENKQVVNKLMYEYFLDSGMSDVAEALKKEAELPINSKIESAPEDLKTVMELYRGRKLVPLIEFLTDSSYTCKPGYSDIMFDLHRQHVIYLLEQNQKVEALMYAQNLQSFNKRLEEIPQLMGALVAYPDIERYRHLFHPNNWQVLESKIARLVSTINSPMEALVTVGAKAMPSMLSIKNVLSRSLLTNSDELPVAVEIPNPVHSTFTCPILKVQSTESNPPIRLGCGHVISKEAVNKLNSNRPVRNPRHGSNRFKCPYCPETLDSLSEKRLWFN